ncbi:8-amino-7-oxononanoate synthase 2 [Thalassoglobus neptunius]|uniref:8-amino-7-oxononanoate synthase n=1 Tax=Thalassoglobus neptunius TaxID=1938619 RepID=A0A5C5X1M5_9PLAN|nr:8-amino-7-oxononanoate synthase [Thalassoglobus neptunius]TWT56710.1 8-amino-7-oxononanoate synthase 2 [Thalassoglobus neptunius]
MTPGPYDWIDEELTRLDQKTLRRRAREVVPISGGQCEIDGKRLWNFSGNDYLGLASHPSVIAAARSALESGVGARASALVSGRTNWHVELEQKLAAFKKTEAAILFPTGFAANFGAITSCVGNEDVVFCDRLNHASLVDGARHSKAKLRIYPHRDFDFLHDELRKSASYRRKLIITDSYFSMDGDIAPLKELGELAETFNAMLLVDEAHATGVFGPTGGGLLEEAELNPDRVICVGTLSKALGSQGGFVVGSQPLCDWLWNTARTGMFSTGLSIPNCAGASAAIDVVIAEPERREWVLRTSTHVREQLRNMNWDVPQDVVGPIIPVIVGSADETLRLTRSLQDEGILVAGIRPPTVPRQSARLRISLSFDHGDESIDALLAAFRRIRQDFD